MSRVSRFDRLTVPSPSRDAPGSVALADFLSILLERLIDQRRHAEEEEEDR